MFIGYFPQEWILFLSIGAICVALLGVFLGMHHDVKSFKALAILLTVILSLVVSSIVFDFHYLHKFADSGETYPKPLYGCSDLQKYLEAVPVFRNPSSSTWKDLTEQPECRSGAIATILVSSVLAWSSVFLLCAFFYIALRFGLNRVRTPQKQDVIIHNLSTAPPSTDIYQDIPFEYTIASLNGDDQAEGIIDCIFENICIGDNEQPDGWDGHIFREFIIQDFKRDREQKKIFKEGFKVRGNEADKKINITWTSFLALKNRAPSEETAKEILEWKAMCAKTSLRTLLGKFVMYYENNGKNPKFFKDVTTIPEKFESELK